MKIIITTPGNFTQEDISKLVEQGVCVIQAKKPQDVRVVGDSEFAISEDVITMSAIHALSNGVSGHSDFVRELYRRLKESKS